MRHRMAVLNRAGRRLAAVAATATLATAGVVAVGATPAMASWTPIYHMDCYTKIGQSDKGYYGEGNCYGQGHWKVVVNCKWGLNPESPDVGNGPGEVQTAIAGYCWWGVNSVKIVEIT